MGQLAPLVFELHTDQRGGSSGLIQAGEDNPVYTALRGGYGAPFDPANYKAPGMGVNLLELSATPDNWNAQTVDQAAQKLYKTLMSVDAVKSGARPLHFFAGHGDVTSGQTGAPGEKGFVKAVKLRLKELASGNSNFSFYDSITDPNDPDRTSGDESTTNWGRGQAIVQGWKPGEPLEVTADSDVGQDPSIDDEPSSSRSSAVERAKTFKQVPLTAEDVVDGFGSDFDSMKSGRLAQALAGAQTDIVKKRMDAGEYFGTKQVEDTPAPTPAPSPEPSPAPTQPPAEEDEE